MRFPLSLWRSIRRSSCIDVSAVSSSTRKQCLNSAILARVDLGVRPRPLTSTGRVATTKNSRKTWPLAKRLCSPDKPLSRSSLHAADFLRPSSQAANRILVSRKSMLATVFAVEVGSFPGGFVFSFYRLQA